MSGQPAPSAVKAEGGDEDDEKDKKKGLLPALKALVGKNKKSREQILYSLFYDAQGELDKMLNFLGIDTWSERKHWLVMWAELIGGEHKKGMNYTQFLRFFKMGDDDWSKRLFDIINANFTGIVPLPEFLAFCARYLLIDKRLAEEFSFRVLLRRAGNFNRMHSVLDLEDLKFLLTYRYKFKNITQRNKRAMDLFMYIDTDGDGGLDVYEYHTFCKKNLALVRFASIIQQHMRQCLFGVKYWVIKSRKLAKAHSSFSALTPLSRINIKSEHFLGELGVELLDKWGNPAASPLDEQITFYSQDDPKDVTEADIAKATAYGKTLIIRPLKPAMTVSRLPRVVFAEDFPEVELERIRRKKAKEEENRKLSKLADGLAARTYQLMIKVCGDLIHGRRPLRQAFNKWMTVSGLRHGEKGGIEHFDVNTTAPSPTTDNKGRKSVAGGGKEDKHKARLTEQLGAKKGMQAVIERELAQVEGQKGEGEEAEEQKADDDIYAQILEATEARAREAKENASTSYADRYLQMLHGELFHPERTRHLALNCTANNNMYPPLPPIGGSAGSVGAGAGASASASHGALPQPQGFKKKKKKSKNSMITS